MAFFFLLDHSECRGAFNFSAPNPIKQHKFNRTLARILKRPAFTTIPKWLLHFMLGERANLLLESQNVVPEKLLNSGFQFQYSDCKKLSRRNSKNKKKNHRTFFNAVIFYRTKYLALSQFIVHYKFQDWMLVFHVFSLHYRCVEVRFYQDIQD